MSGLSGLSSLNNGQQSSHHNSPHQPQQLRHNSRPKASNSSPLSSPRLDQINPIPQMPQMGPMGDKPSLTVKNLAKLQQKKANNDLLRGPLLDKYKKAVPTAPDAPVDDALWYWLKSQQAMLGFNSLYSQVITQNSISNLKIMLTSNSLILGKSPSLLESKKLLTTQPASRRFNSTLKSPASDFYATNLHATPIHDA